MNLVLLTHPDFIGSRSQRQFAEMLAARFAARGHAVELRKPVARVRAWAPPRLAKWAGYVDQFVLFRIELARAARRDPADTLYVFCDQALGPWVPALAHRPHVVHCHDLLALRSALGGIAEWRTGWTGRLYQRWIRAGFRRARHFVAISEQTRADLLHFGGVAPVTCEVVYNGLAQPLRRRPREAALAALAQAGLPGVGAAGLLLHVGGGQWYKNTAGVVALYARHAAACGARGAPVGALWLVGPPPAPAVAAAIAAIPAPGVVHAVRNVPAAALEALYSLAGALVFPSLAEGFGWPIAEALACGCPVLTTAEAPMTEVGGPHADYLRRLAGPDDLDAWAAEGALLLARMLARPPAQREAAAAAAIAWTARYDAERAIDRYLDVYTSVLAREAGSGVASALAS